MYKVIIADDEVKICQLIQILVDWDAKGLEIAGVAHDGREALQMVEDTAADIIITDIRMPELNGLDLVEALKNARPQISCVIISGYQEFEYARRALQYGVEEYLLKPVREEDLNRVLDEIISKKNLIRQESEEKAAMEEISSEQQKKMHELFVRNIAEGNLSLAGKSREQLEQEYYCTLSGNTGLLFGIKVNILCEWDHQDDTRYELNKWMRIVQGSFEKNTYPFSGAVISGDILYGFINYDKQHEASVNQLFHEIERKYLHADSWKEHHRYTIGISSGKTDAASWKDLGDEVRFAVLERFSNGRSGNIISFRSRETSFRLNDFISVPLQKRILASVEEEHYAELDEIVEGLDTSLRNEIELDGAFVLSVWEELIALVLIGYKHVFTDEKRKEEREHTAFLLRSCSSQRELAKCARQILGRLRKESEKLITERSSRPVEEAKAYVLRHFNENCSLDEMSERVGLSAAYFSSLFKKEEQIGFVEYVTGVRMQKAKELLMDRQKKITEIAEAVGYQDEKYFSRAFRKSVGLTPSAYRKIYS